MNAEALVGRVLGTCTLRRVIGHGGMGTVYLARQSQPRRKVAVKVFLQASALEPLQYMDFLVRFRHEMDAVAALEHQHILSIYEYGERDGFVYLAMPYISGQTLETVLTRQGMLPFPIVLNYLDQLATAIDYAHERGVLHRDLKPANILVTTHGNLLLTDFALSKVMSEESMAQVRQFRVGMLDYMSPELIMGKEVDEGADLYALGAILYRMVTGTVPFQGELLTEVAKQHLQAPPPSPSSKRPELPVAAGQAVLRALAKRSADRYAHAQDLATAFRLALAVTDTQVGPGQNGVFLPSRRTSTGLYSPSGLFDPKWRTGMMPAVSSEQTSNQSTPVLPTIIASTSSDTADESRRRLLAPIHLANAAGAATAAPSGEMQGEGSPLHTAPLPPLQRYGGTSPDESRGRPQGSPLHTAPLPPLQRYEGTSPALSSERTGEEEQISLPMPVANPITPVQATPMFPVQATDSMGELTDRGTEQGTTGTIIKLTGPAKIVNVPVAGKPGRYITGLLPISSATQQEVNEPSAGIGAKGRLQKGLKIIGLVMVALLVLATATFWFVHMHSSSSSIHKATVVVRTPDVGATMTAQAVATVNANIILSDPLSQNIHNWPIASSGSMTYAFEDGAYHITDNDNTRGAPAILPDLKLNGPFAYTLTMEEIKGDDTSVNNEFGMIIRASIQNKNGKMATTFYSFEVLNKPGGEYQFWKYDDSQRSSVNPWKELGHHPFGKEFHQGQGPKSINTFKIVTNGKNFTLIVNGKQVWTVQDSSFAIGGLGMLVNLKGTEVAFSNLILTHS
jgi:serine/threonine protein kinase